MPAQPTVVLDCRWLGIGGPGRTTELVLRGLAEDPPAGRWVLWGPEATTTALAWPGADVRPIAEDPRLLLGQRHAFELPRGDFVVFMHQQRPLRNVASATLIYDTIALRYGAPRVQRELKRRFLHRVSHTSRTILTISEHSKASIVRDLDVAPGDVHVLRFPFDDAFADRVLALRESAARADVALFIGGFLPHKNLPRLLAAFERTEFCRDGGRLVLVGATPTQASGLLETLDRRQREYVSVRHSCSQADMDLLYATSLFLVQPSLEEGFGLPAWEAMCVGLPVCVSDGGALPEVTAGFAQPFLATSVPAMTGSIDACARRARAFGADQARAQSLLLRGRSPTISDLGARFAAIVAEQARR